MKLGIYVSIELDLIKSLLDFLFLDFKECVYVYIFSDFVVIDNWFVYVVFFE